MLTLVTRNGSFSKTHSISVSYDYICEGIFSETFIPI